MSAPSEVQDYTADPPKRHHNFYRDSGDITIQVQNAIFKIHRFFLIDHSSVLRDMLSLPQSKETCDGTDQRPLVLSGDLVADWERLLGAFYTEHLITRISYSGEELMGILRLAHKYSMDTLENDALSMLEEDKTTAGYVDLMVGSQIVGSDSHYQKALVGLKTSDPIPSVEQARRIGAESIYLVLTERTVQQIGVPVCRSCFASDNLRIRCNHCRTWQ